MAASSSPPPPPLPSPSSCLSFSDTIAVPSHLPLHRCCFASPLLRPRSTKRAHASPSYPLLRIAAFAGRKNHSGIGSSPPDSSTESQKNCAPPPPPPPPPSPPQDARIASGYGAAKDLRCETVELPEIPRGFEASTGAGLRADSIDEVEEERIQMTWFQQGFVSVVRPLVRVLNGANLKELSDGNRISARETKQNLAQPLWRSDDDEEAVKEEDLMASWSFVKMLTGSWPPWYHRRKIREGLRQAEVDFFTFSSHVGKFLFTMMATGTVLATGYDLVGGDSELETVIWLSWLAGIIIGSMIGAEKVMQKRFRSGPRNIVITGSTRGLGKALAREFLLAGDRVVITSRSPESVIETVKELQLELEARLYHPFSINNDPLSPKDRNDCPRVIGIACDVSKVDDVKALAEFAGSELGSIDLWINNAGINKGFRPLTQFSDEDIQQIVSANMMGSLLCTREAIRVMQTQRKGGHIFNMDGAGSGGSSTPLTAVYGATKCGLRQLQGSLLQECKRSRIGIHTASPGMVLTDLLLSGASLQNKKMFNIICELPETVARTLVPRMRDIKGTGKAINFLTPPRILLALVTAWLRRGRWFDEEGRAVYAAEADRLRNWAEIRARLPVSAAMEQFSDTTLVSVFSITAICAFIILESGISGT